MTKGNKGDLHLSILGLQPRDKAAMLGVNTIEILPNPQELNLLKCTWVGNSHTECPQGGKFDSAAILEGGGPGNE